MEDVAQDVGSGAHCTVGQNDSDSDDLHIPPPSPRIENFKETVQAFIIEDVQTFLENCVV